MKRDEVRRLMLAVGWDGSDRLVWLAIENHASADGAGWPSLAQLAAFTGLNRRTVQRSLRRLEDDGEVRTIPSFGHPNTYMITACGQIVTSPNGGAVSDRPGAVSDTKRGGLTPPGRGQKRTGRGAGYAQSVFTDDRGTFSSGVGWIRDR